MSTNSAAKSGNSFKAGLTNLIQKNRLVLLSVLVGVLLALVGYAIWSEVDKASKYSFAVSLDQIQEDFSKWKDVSLADKKSDYEGKIQSGLTALLAKSKDAFSALQANYVAGIFYYEKEDWKKAAEAFQSALAMAGSSYLYPVIVLNLGASLENLNNLPDALTAYNGYLAQKSQDKIFSPEILFKKGLLLNKMQKSDEAKAAFKVAIDTYPESNWTKLARNTILKMN